MGATTRSTTALSLMTLCVIINNTQQKDSHYKSTDSLRALDLTQLITTISITTSSILTVSKTLLSVKTLSLITLSITKFSIATLSMNKLRITTFSRTIKIS
jgi:hypothetical protein